MQGIPHGQSLSANELNLYLMRELYKENNDHIWKESSISNLSGLSCKWKYNHFKDIDDIYALYDAHMISVLLKLIKIKLAILKGLLSQNQKLETLCEWNRNRKI